MGYLSPMCSQVMYVYKKKTPYRDLQDVMYINAKRKIALLVSLAFWVVVWVGGKSKEGFFFFFERGQPGFFIIVHM